MITLKCIKTHQDCTCTFDVHSNTDELITVKDIIEYAKANSLAGKLVVANAGMSLQYNSNTYQDIIDYVGYLKLLHVNARGAYTLIDFSAEARRLHRTPKHVFLHEAAYIAALRDNNVSTYEEFVDTYINALDATEFTSNIDAIMSDLRSYRTYNEFKLSAISLNEYELCVDKFGHITT